MGVLLRGRQRRTLGYFLYTRWSTIAVVPSLPLRGFPVGGTARLRFSIRPQSALAANSQRSLFARLRGTPLFWSNVRDRLRKYPAIPRQIFRAIHSLSERHIGGRVHDFAPESLSVIEVL